MFAPTLILIALLGQCCPGGNCAQQPPAWMQQMPTVPQAGQAMPQTQWRPSPYAVPPKTFATSTATVSSGSRVEVSVWTGPGCVPCDYYKAEAIEPLRAEGYTIHEYDSSTDPLATRWRIKQLPTTVVFISGPDGSEVGRFVGKVDIDVLRLICRLAGNAKTKAAEFVIPKLED